MSLHMLPNKLLLHLFYWTYITPIEKIWKWYHYHNNNCNNIFIWFHLGNMNPKFISSNVYGFILSNLISIWTSRCVPNSLIFFLRQTPFEEIRKINSQHFLFSGKNVRKEAIRCCTFALISSGRRLNLQIPFFFLLN